jgi:protein SCO1/2
MKPMRSLFALSTLTMAFAAGSAYADGNSDAVASHHLRVPPKVMRRLVEYELPSVRLVRADGHKVNFPEDIDDGRPVILDFVYTTCTTVCPVNSQTFLELEQRLGHDRERVHLVSVSIDPEEDTPARLTEYARRFEAGSEWSFYTGTEQASEAVQQAFHVFRGSKMLHEPVTLLRPAPGKPWVRFDGFVTAGELLDELHEKVALR